MREGSSETYPEDDLDWRRRAACRNEDPELFFPAPGKKAQIEKAKEVCRTRSVATICLTWALEHYEKDDSIWGGLTGDEREALKSRMAKRADS